MLDKEMSSIHTVAEDSLWESFTKSFGMVILSEIGDKTFFMAALLAMRYGRSKVFAGSWGALAVMTCLSTALGWAAPHLIPDTYVHWAATALFLLFGCSMSYQAVFWKDPEVSELDEVEAELKEHNLTGSDPSSPAGESASATEVLKAGESTSSKGNGKPQQRVSVYASSASESTCMPKETTQPKVPKTENALKGALYQIVSPIVVEGFLLTFVAEWGDRSQMATIGLAMAGNSYGVCLGGVLGHAVCTGIAVLGGKGLAAHINERMILGGGALLFLLFGAWAAMDLV